jgi:DNA invertase Pin-like site-specific DNA recombinase
MKTLAYLRVSKDTQDVMNQKLAILEFAQQERMQVDQFIEVTVSSRKSPKERKIDLLLDQLNAGDTLIVSELSRMGRSVGEIITTVDTLGRKNIRFLAVKEGIRLSGEADLQTKMMVTMFSLFAEMERELISLRTKEALAVAKAKGKKLGRPKGSFGRSKLDGREEEIKKLLALEVSKASIAKITGVDRSTLCYFIKSRGLVENP